MPVVTGLTRAELIQNAMLSALGRHAEALNAGVGVSQLQCCIKFDRTTGLPTKAILHLEMENFIVSRSGSIKEFTFEST